MCLPARGQLERILVCTRALSNNNNDDSQSSVSDLEALGEYTVFNPKLYPMLMYSKC
jgi:hypothetical protein